MIQIKPAKIKDVIGKVAKQSTALLMKPALRLISIKTVTCIASSDAEMIKKPSRLLKN